MGYSKDIEKYVNDLGRKVSSPGGGSTAGLGFCVGVSLIQMALAYSDPGSGDIRSRLEGYKQEMLPYIDLDGEIFSAVMRENDPAVKEGLLKRSQKLFLNIGDKCYRILSIAREVYPGLKESLKGDFNTGMKFLETALYSCLESMKANRTMFSLENEEETGIINGYLSEFKKWLKY